MKKAFLVWGLLALAVSARAGLTSYIYTGDPFDNLSASAYSAGCSGTYANIVNCSGFITISFTVSDSLVGLTGATITPLSFSMSDQDGLTITDTTATASTFTVTTDGSGDITAWYVSASISTATCISCANTVQQITSGSGNISPGSGRPVDLSFNDLFPSDAAGQDCLMDYQAGLSCQTFVNANPGVNIAWFAYADFGGGGTWFQEELDSPEPSTVLLLGAGLLALAGWHRVGRRALDSPKV
jgi:hypothetical protein